MGTIDSLELLQQYALVILPILVVAEQIGVPLPAVPALLGVGALAAHGRASIPLVIAAIAVVALCADLCWYELGRRRGATVLAKLCRLSLEPDSCVRRAETVFTRHGARGMLVAKFLPGLTTVMPPLAGIFAVGRLRFALYDLGGVGLWAGWWIGLGYLFSDAIAIVTARAVALGRTLGLVAAVIIVGYVALKYARRRLFMRRLRMARIAPATLKQQLDAGEDVTVIDLRTPLDVAATPYAIPGSRWLPVTAIDEHEAELLRARDLVLYCS